MLIDDKRKGYMNDACKRKNYAHPEWFFDLN